MDTVKNRFASHEQGAVEALIREMVRDPDEPLEGYGGSRDNVRIRDMGEAVTYLRRRDVDLPWNLRE